MQQILQLFLPIEHSPATDQRRHWCDEIDGFRDQIDRKLSPTTRRQLKREFEQAFARARRRVQRKMARYGETHAAANLPARCPYTLEQVLGEWLPHEGPCEPA